VVRQVFGIFCKLVADMLKDTIPEPFQYNPLKHHLSFIRKIVAESENRPADQELIRLMKHIGTSVMDVYAGLIDVKGIINEVGLFLDSENINDYHKFSEWAGNRISDFKVAVLSDYSQWVLKYHNSMTRFVHIFPARSSPHTFRVKANTLKSAILYLSLEGKDFVTEDHVNRARALAGLSPVKDIAETEAISEMIEILRS
jgi:hypothetical protein